MPVYNTGQTLEQTIMSLLQQTYSQLEIIIVNDGSSDDQTLKKIAELKSKYPQLKLINQNNQGLVAARNAGIKQAKGDFIFCLDSDDLVDKKYVTKIMAVFEQAPSNVAIVTSYVQAFGNSREQWSFPEYDLEKLKYANSLHVASIFKKNAWQLVGGYDSNFKDGFEDWDFWLSIIKRGLEWRVLNQPLFYYRRRPNTMISKANQKRQAISQQLIKKHRDLYLESSDEEILQKMHLAEQQRCQTKNLIKRLKAFMTLNFWRRFRIFQ